MSSQTIALNNGQQAIIHTDLSRIFVGQNRYEKGSYNNATYDPITLTVGTLLGRVSATGLLKPLDSDAVDGSQFPVGVLAETITVEDGTTEDIYFCVSGDVIASKIILAAGDTLDTVISSRRLRDRIGADTVGIKIITANTEMSAEDND
jgi:hypothetical protein